MAGVGEDGAKIDFPPKMDSDFDPDPADGDEALAPPKGFEEPKVNADALVGELSRAFSPVGVLAKEKAPGVENMVWQMRQCRLDFKRILARDVVSPWEARDQDLQSE